MQVPEQAIILSIDKIVPAECLAGHRTSVDTDLEIRQVRHRKLLQQGLDCAGSLDQMEIIGTPY
jgi:hypothetical protein